MYVCLCTGVTDTDIKNAVAEGASTVEAVMLATRAGSRCGTCRTEVATIVGAVMSGDESALGASRPCHERKRRLPLHDGSLRHVGPQPHADIDERAA